MKSLNWKYVAEVVGIVAIVGSLLFVGMQMKQTQEIAFSDSYQSRTDTSLGLFKSAYDTPEILSFWTKTSQALLPDLYQAFSDPNAGNLSPEEQTAAIFYFLSWLSYLENMHFQYRNGFISEEQWQANISDLEFYLSIDFYRMFWEEIEGGSTTLSFRDVVNDVVRKLDAKSNQ